ncbi:MAG: acetyl-CoA carboxylase biotin carboxylase subunit [Terriglobia bacterium]
MFKKILVANRGEIAVRVMRACREMGIQSVAVYSEADRQALHVRYADEAFYIGAAESTRSYLRIENILDAAEKSGAEAIHPGYGFLSENPEFARASTEAGLVFIGPSAEAMELMGSKTAARRLASKEGLPVVPGTDRSYERLEELQRVASGLGYPVMLKAVAGGGGMGLRRVSSEQELESAFRSAQSEARSAFNDASVYVEKYLERPRHIEIQIIGDLDGNVIHLGERECSLQRRHQKLIEESPSPFVDEALRSRMGEAAITIGRSARYTNAGTVEFLVDQNRNFYFLEMNTRLQVEHPVTELVTGLDLVKEQVRIAAGEKLRWTQETAHRRGHALECRIYAEDPANNFFPSPGRIERLRVPMGPAVRDDSGIFEGWTVPVEYDPLLSKLIAWGTDRQESISRMKRALGEYEVDGIKTNIPFYQFLMDHPDFIQGDFDTGLIDRLLTGGFPAAERPPADSLLAVVLGAALEARRRPNRPGLPSTPDGSAWKLAGRRRLLDRSV